MVLTVAAKALQKAEGIKESVLKVDDLITHEDAWTCQQQLLNTYRQVLILDLEYALDKKVEQDLWNYAVKNFITKLQMTAKDKKNPKRSDAQALLSACLEGAAGFYIQLLQELCSAFQLDLPFRKHNVLLGILDVPAGSPTFHGVVPKKSSSFYLCQHCLVHLGDIARYRNQNRQAEIFYKYAMMIIPSSGQPYNQLAILEASRGDKVGAVYHYVRAIALSHPFSAAASNLSKALEKHSDDTVKMDGNGKLSANEYLAAFLKLHGLLHSYAELDKAEKLVQILTTSLTAHIATESLPAWKLIQMVVINMFAMFRLENELAGRERPMTGTEARVQTLISHYLAGCLNAFLLPVYTIKSEDALLEYFAMPAIKLTLEWVRLQPNVLQSTGFTTRRQIWPSLSCLLTRLQPASKLIKLKLRENVPLPEDRDLRGFHPLDPVHKNLDFYAEEPDRDEKMLNSLRAARLVNIGIWLAKQAPSVITQSVNGGFEPVEKPELPGDLLKELEQLSQGKSSIPLSVSSGSGTGSSTPDIGQPCSQDALPEKRGILKNENNPEKSSEQKVAGSRIGRNVALSALFNRSADDVKQVTFRSPSPSKTKVSPSHKPTAIKSTKRNEGAKPDATTDVDPKILQQKMLLDVLTTSEKKNEEQTQQKQQLLSALFDETKASEQPQNMSGLLNLNKQQQELLTISKQPPKPVAPRPLVQYNVGPAMTAMQPQRMRPPGPPGQQGVAAKMEAARKEYEDAMFVLQQRKEDPIRYIGAGGETDAYRPFEPIMFPIMGAPVQAPPPMYVSLNPPMMGMQPFAFKVAPGVMMPWQEQEQPQPPMPPASWWAQGASQQPPPMGPGREPPPGYCQPPPPLNTYSLWEPDPNRNMAGRLMNQQSFWSGPGPSPLERLLEQQRKQMRDSDSNT